MTYQEGSTVSKEIIRKPTGTVTIFSFDKDQGLSVYTAPFDALVYFAGWRGRDHHLQRISSSEGREMIIMPGGKPHVLKAMKRFKMMLVMVRS